VSRHQWCFVCSSLIPLYHTSPVITLLGESEVTIEVGSNYEDAGATAFDNLDGDLTASIITSSNVDTSTVGSYLVTYNVTDTAGNTAIEVTRVVNVVIDTTKPIITLLGESEVTIEVSSNYEDARATAFDNLDGDLTASIITSSNVDTSTVGAYLVTYNVSDSAGNTAIEVTRVVNIVETAKILLNGHVYVTSIDGLILTADDGKCYRLKIIQGPSIQLVEVNCN